MSSIELKKFSAEVADDARAEDAAKDPVRQQKSTPGVGTDIFVRKKKPGSQVGKGYFVDIYENGVKIDTIELPTKKEVTKLIQKFKDKYNTDRAFQNEMQVHITYKTKKERGDPMASIDTILTKKAQKIQEMLYRITEPELPLIKRIGQDEYLNNVSSVPETSPTGTEDKESIKRYIADEIIAKFTKFVKEKSEGGSAPVDEPVPVDEPALPAEDFIAAKHQTKEKFAAIDDIFNPLRKWYGVLSREIEKWNNMSDNMLAESDLQDIIQQTESIILSQDPGLIQKNTGIDVTPEIATLMYEVGTKSVGKPGEAETGGELGGNPEDFNKESSVKIAEDEKDKPTIENTNELLASFAKHVQTQGNTMPITDIAKDLNVTDPDILKTMHSILSEKDELVESENAIKTYIEDRLNLERTSCLHPSILESKAQEFWKYAGDYKGIANIEDVFIDWVKKTSCDLKKASDIWKKVSDDIMVAFDSDKRKTAGEGYSIGDIYYITDRDEYLFGAYLEYDKTRYRLVMTPYTDPLGTGYDAMLPLIPDYEHNRPLATIEEAIAEVPNVLRYLMQVENVTPLARALLNMQAEPTVLTITANGRTEMGGNTSEKFTTSYNVTPYGEDVTS